jgi:phage gp36-like protein
MPYCTVTDMLKLVDEATLTQLSDLSNTGTIDYVVVDEAIETADAQIDGFIANKVDTVPLVTVPVLISKISCKMALHELYTNKMMSCVPESVADWYKDCLRVLESIRSGKMHLIIPAAGSKSEYRVNKTAAEQIFPKKELDKF